MNALRLAAGFALILGLAGCGGSDQEAATSTVMPDVVGRQLDVALSDIKSAGFEDKVEVTGGGTFGIVNKSNWQVCDQSPAAGLELKGAPQLTVDRSCGDDASESTTTSTVSTTVPSVSTTAPTTIEDITVDALLDKLNSADMGGIRVGDQFRLTAELFEDDAWGTGATGEYSVALKAKGGKDDLFVFVDESDASGWHNGTKVEMVVRAEERTVNGETSGGWLKALSVKTLSD